MIDSSLWKPIDNNFNLEQHLYHYTDIEKCIKILYNKTLRFSSLTNVNDTSESKSKISFDRNQNYPERECAELSKKIDFIRRYINKNSHFLKMLCFSMDKEIKNKNTKNGKWMYFDKFRDMIGRGLALPRMWAQYAKNCTGVCLVFNKDKILEEVSNNFVFTDGKVQYDDFFETYKFSLDEINTLYSIISKNPEGRQVFTKIFLQNESFIR